MTVFGKLLAFCLWIIAVENRMLPTNFVTIEKIQPVVDESATQSEIDDETPFHRVIHISEAYGQGSREDYDIQTETNLIEESTKKPCSVVVLSNIQNPSMQSLLRKYRYDANGLLIPSSVRYFIKMPQGYGTSPVLVPLNDKAFSPLGGFVRYYKEVPPIPQSW